MLSFPYQRDLQLKWVSNLKRTTILTSEQDQRVFPQWRRDISEHFLVAFAVHPGNSPEVEARCPAQWSEYS